MTGKEYIQHAEERYEKEKKEEISLEDYIDRVIENPSILKRKGVNYILSAIKHFGKREVFEKGEKLDRWRFFDDPCRNGKNAIIGNTKVLNEFVKSLEAMSLGSGKQDKMFWVEGPTASGKSEFRRCMVSGLNGFSKTKEGRIYTIKMNATGLDRKKYEEESWYKSPVQADPISILPESTKNKLIKELEQKEDDFYDVPKLPPFSFEARESILNSSKEFEEVISDKRLKVTNYIVGQGDGIGVISSEDKDTPTKEKLIGRWNKYALSQGEPDLLDGKMDKRLFIYDGLLSQGRNILSIIEDSVHHFDILLPLLNILDENSVKIDSETNMSINSLILMISNPDLSAEITKNESMESKDPMKAVKRRIDKYEFNYLVNVGLESKMIIKEIFGMDEDNLIDKSFDYTDEIEIDKNKTKDRIEPRAIQAASIYDIISRIKISAKGKSSDINEIEKALVLDEESILRDYNKFTRDISYSDDYDEENVRSSYKVPVNKNINDEEYEEKEVSEIEPEDIETDNTYRSGIPVTYTRDMISQLLQKQFNRSNENIILPQDVIKIMRDNMDDAPVFSTSKAKEYKSKSESIHDYILSLQERDVILSILDEFIPSKSYLKKYVDNVLEWQEQDEEPSEDEKVMMKTFEIDHFAFDEENYSDKLEPNSKVKNFRQKQIVKRSRSVIYSESKDYDYFNIPEVRNMIKNYGWGDVLRKYDKLKLEDWEDPLEKTETNQVKNECIDNMVEKYNYSREAAKIISEMVVYHRLIKEKKPKLTSQDTWEKFSQKS